MVGDKDIDLKAIGQRIRGEREKLGLSREKFAEIIGLSDYYVGQLERGERQMSLPVLVKISKHLRESLDYLIFGAVNQDASYFLEGNDHYGVSNGNMDKSKEINVLLDKCSDTELELIYKVIRTILPYLS
ncbi:MAG: DNA-binding protein [Desulfitibacter sp. BRH_c19]|nr:MAG: DNA-binding protein [Desulfitibacter sp. BRH_c19]